MKRYIILHPSLTLLVFIACISDQEQDDKNITFQRSDFKVREPLSGKIIEFDNLTLRPSQIQLFGSFLATCNQEAEEQFHIFNLNTAHKGGECISVGQRPKEMMTPYFVNRNGSVVTSGMMTSTIFAYSIPELTSRKGPECTSRISLGTEPLWNNIRSLGNEFLGVSYQETSPRFLFDQTGKKAMDFDTYSRTEQEYTPAELVNASRADLITSRKEKVAVVHYFTDLVCVYNVNGTLEKQLRGPDRSASVFKEFRDGDITGSKASPQTYKGAFYSPVNVGNSLFVLCNGKMVTGPNYNTLCKGLFVIEWDGGFECHYTLDQGVSSIAIDNQKRKTYGISDDPEYHVVAFGY